MMRISVPIALLSLILALPVEAITSSYSLAPAEFRDFGDPRSTGTNVAVIGAPEHVGNSLVKVSSQGRFGHEIGAQLRVGFGGSLRLALGTGTGVGMNSEGVFFNWFALGLEGRLELDGALAETTGAVDPSGRFLLYDLPEISFRLDRGSFYVEDANTIEVYVDRDLSLEPLELAVEDEDVLLALFDFDTFRAPATVTLPFVARAPLEPWDVFQIEADLLFELPEPGTTLLGLAGLILLELLRREREP